MPEAEDAASPESPDLSPDLSREAAHDDLLSSLRASFAGRLLYGAADTEPFVVDWRRVWRGDCLAVVQPDSTADVAAVVAWCASNSVAVVPQGGNTGLSGGATPARASRAIVLSTTRMRSVRHVDPVNNTITVDAGCTLQEVQHAAAAVGRMFPLSLAAEGTCTIGGNLATNAGGTAVLRYGTARELCLGIEVVTAAGAVWDGLRGLRKDNTGYDLKDLFIGSEGTLGVITAAVLKLFPKPAERHVALATVGSIDQAVRLFGWLSDALGDALVACEALNHICVDLVHAHSPVRSPLPVNSGWVVLVEAIAMRADGYVKELLDESLSLALDEGLANDVVVAESIAQAERFWALRENVSEAQGAAGPTIKHDVAVPLSRVARFVADADAAVRAAFPDLRFVTFGHLGDGNLHYNFSPGQGMDPERFRALQEPLNTLVHSVVRAHGGSISAEHGLGVLRRDEADRYRSETERALQRVVKQALDPMGIMNPGKFFPER